MKPTKSEKFRVVTPQQYAAGYYEIVDGVIYHRRYPGYVRKDKSGNYIVVEPDPKRRDRNAVYIP